MWECGLKQELRMLMALLKVTPHVGVWIETWVGHICIMSENVTPHVGVWIETNYGER